MNATQPNIPGPKQIVELLRRNWKLWLTPAAAITALVGLYAVFHEPTWEASQALIVRNEAANAEKGPGKFSYPEEMKTIQETMFEVVKSRGVLEAALRKIGPPAGYDNPNAWPSDRDIADARLLVKFAPPKGAEFGKTEVFYLTARAESRQRSIALNEALFEQLQLRFQQLRDAKAESMAAELTKTVHLAKADLEESTAALAAIERRAGSDLAELRSMQDMAGSDSALRRSAEDLRVKLHENAAAAKDNATLLALLAEAQNDPGKLVSAPNRLLESHQALRRLKDGLIDAQLRTAALLGTMSESHPRVLAAKESEAEISRQLHAELAVARNSVEVESRVIADRRVLLEDQLARTIARMSSLAEMRADYANLAAETKSRATLLERAEQNLAEARAAGAGAKAASLINRIDAPDAGIKPVGPGRWTIALCGAFGGLFAGFGIVLLAVPVAHPAAEPMPVSTNGNAKNRHPTTWAAAVQSPWNGRVSVHRAWRTLAKNGR